jgi:hypothetical protein
MKAPAFASDSLKSFDSFAAFVEGIASVQH